MENGNPTLLYWKWDEGIFAPGVMDAKLNDIMRRSSFSMIYVSFHHMSRRFDDPALQALIGRCAQRLAQAGRRLLLDVDVRNELAALLEVCPGGASKSIRFWRCALDGEGRAALATDNPQRGRTGRAVLRTGPVRVAGCWAYEPDGEGRYRDGTLRAARCRFDVDGDRTTFAIEADGAGAGIWAIVAAVYEAGIPDLGAEATFAFYESLIDSVAHLPLGGIANDEWGYDLALQWDEGLFFVEDFPYADSILAEYAHAAGRALDADCLHLALAPSGDEGRAYGVVNRYLQVLRGQMRRGNDWFYDAAKRHFGQEAFVGVHPTLWGDYTDFALDAPHNGFSWWETRRDVAQTDEFVQMPIRLALAHKWSRAAGPAFYNMWYSGNSQQFDTYLMETWRNARFGGRTHYLGYECPNEGGVYQLKHAGDLESIERMERQIARLGRFQRSLPDCRVLVTFGVEAAGNWVLARSGPRVARNMGVLRDVLRYTASLFEHFLCDLVPTSEIANGSVTWDGTALRYGSQAYDAAIWIAPACADPAVYGFFQRYGAASARLITVGSGTHWSDGSAAGPLQSRGLSEFSCHLEDLDGVSETITILNDWHIPRNRSDHGAVYQDGSLVFTCNGTRPDRNPLAFTERLGGHTVQFQGEDFLALRFDGGGCPAAHAAGRAVSLSVDGVALA